MSKLVGIDATDVFCPEFTTPVISLIKRKVPIGGGAVIKTKEKKGLKRIQHICASFDWAVIAFMEQDDIFYIQIQRGQ